MEGTLRKGLVVCLLAVAGCRVAGEDPGGKAAQGARAPEAPPARAPSPRDLVGEWVRTDSPYVISIEGASDDGKLLARYLNPRPINVARAEWKLDSGRLHLLVEMRDRLYPGSYYELTYDAASDGLSGVYHQLAAKEDFDVAFYRMKKGGDAAP